MRRSFIYALLLSSSFAFADDDFEYDYNSILQSIKDDTSDLSRISTTADFIRGQVGTLIGADNTFHTYTKIFQDTLLPVVQNIGQNISTLSTIRDNTSNIYTSLSQLSSIYNTLSSIKTSVQSLSIPNYSDSLSSILNSIGSLNTSLDSIESNFSGLALDSTVSDGFQNLRDDFADFRNTNIADIMTYTADTSSWLGDYIYPDVHAGLTHLSYMRDYLSSISSKINITLSSLSSEMESFRVVFNSIDSSLASIYEFLAFDVNLYLDDIFSLQNEHLPSIDNGIDTLNSTVSDILTKLNEFSSSESSYDDSKWSTYRSKADTFFDSFSSSFDGSRMDPSYRAVILNPTNGIFGTLGIERIPYSMIVRDSYATHVTANLVYLRQILSSISFINANILDTSHKILDRMPEQKDTSSEQSELENSLSSTADGRESIVDSLDFSCLEYNPKNEGVDAYFDYSDIFESFESDMPGTITFTLPEFSLYGHSFGGQTVNIATERIRPLVDTMRACFAVLYWTVVGAIVLFGFKIFLKFVRHFSSLVKVALQW